MSVVSKNPFDLLGDDGEQSSSPAPAKAPAAKKEAAPQRTVPGATTGGNNNAERGAQGGRGGNRGGRYPSRGGPRNVARGDGDKGPRNTGPNPEAEGQDTAGGFDGERVPASKRAHNGPDKHTKGPRGEGRVETSGGHRSRVGASRGAKTPAFGGERRQFERKSGTLPDSQKKVDQGWGANEGTAELNAEVEGENDAQAEEAAPGTPAEADDSAAKGTGFDDANGAAEENAAEPEEVQKSYDDFLAEKAQQAFAFGKKEARQVNSETVEGKAFVREGIDDFFSGKEKTTAAKAKAAKKEKVYIEVDGQFAQPAGARRGGDREERRGGDRGGRGGRGRGAARGRGGPRGGFGGNNTGRSNNNGGANIDTSNESAFPALGA